jgi:glycosyltransferase involved in cell wall biosynthesis
MRVAYLFPHFTYPGGATNYVINSSKCLVKSGIDVTIITQRISDIAIPDGVKCIQIGGDLPKSIKYWLMYPQIFNKIKRILDNEDFDILFPQVFPSNYWAFLYKKFKTSQKIVWYCHEPNAFVHNYQFIRSLPHPIKELALFSNPIIRPIDIILSKNCDKILTNSNFTKNNIKQILNLESEVVYTGLFFDKYPPIQLPESNYILFVGRIMKSKNLNILLKVFSAILNDGNNVNLIILGEGEEKENIEKIILREGMETNVKLIGRVDDQQLIEYYSRAICVVYPSINEPFGLVPIEAQACHVPVIAFKSGGVIETVIDNKTGILVDPYDEKGLKNAIEKLLNDKKYRIIYGNNGYSEVISKYSWERHTETLIRIFKEELNE